MEKRTVKSLPNPLDLTLINRYEVGGVEASENTLGAPEPPEKQVRILPSPTECLEGMI